MKAQQTVRFVAESFFFCRAADVTNYVQDAVYFVNPTFSCEKTRFRLPEFRPAEQREEEVLRHSRKSSAVCKVMWLFQVKRCYTRVEEDRKVEVEAAIVRVMKSRWGI